MYRPRRNFDREFGDGAVRAVNETGWPVVQGLGVNAGTKGGAEAESLNAAAMLSPTAPSVHNALCKLYACEHGCSSC